MVRGSINTKPILSLIDTGASGISFINPVHPLLAGLSLIPIPLQHLRTLAAFNGSEPTDQVTHFVKVPYQIGRHLETLHAFVVPLDKWPLVLGLP